MVLAWLEEGEKLYEVLPPDDSSGDVLLELQVTTRSPMGAIAYETGGILIDGGWLQIYGSGNANLPINIASFNRARSEGLLIVANDVVGGFFAINAGSLAGDLGEINYWSPDNLEWEPLGVGYSAWLCWCVTNGVDEFYKDLKWLGWEKDFADLPKGYGFFFYPFLWTTEGSINACKRGMISIGEIYDLKKSVSDQLL